MVRIPNLPTATNISADDLVVLYDNSGNLTGRATLTQAVTAGAGGLVGSGDMILSAAQTVTGAKQFNPGTLLDKGNLVYNVKAFLAVGDGTTDDTTAIQQAIDAASAAGGGVVSFPKGTYKITSQLTVYSNVTLQGVSMESSIIKQVTLNAHGIYGSGVSSFCIFDMGIQGNGTGSSAGTGTGIGILLEYGGAGNNPFHNFRKVMVRNWGSDGLKIQTPIVNTYNGVYSAFNGGHGFNWYEGGTSCNFQACWARQNAQAGYRWFESVYQSLNGCAADNNGVNYWIEDAQSIGFSGCGSEGALRNGGSYDGYGWYVDNSSVITLDACWVTDNRNLGVWVTNGAQAVSLNIADNTPNGTAVNFIKVDSGCNVSIYELHNTTANSLATGTTNTINDGAGGVRGVDVFVLSATATTVPVFNANKALISSAVTPTELGYLSGVTSALQTQLNGKQPLDTNLTTLASLTPTTNNMIVSVGSAWASRTPAETKTTLALNNVSNTSDATKNTAVATLTNKTLTEPKFADLGFIADANGNEMLVFDSAASAVPYVRMNNAATGGVVGFEADGETNQHIQIIGKGNGLTKQSVLRQDNTSDSYKHNAVVLSGWGVFAAGAASNKSEAVTFGITFAQRPIVTISVGGDDDAGGTSYGDGGNEDKGPIAIKAHTITTTGFTAHVHTADGTSWAAGTTVFYQWIAIGEL